MAENKLNTVKYKFGQKELNLDDYIYNLGTNLQRYIDNKTDWSEGQKEEFINSYNRYIEGLTLQRDNNTNRFYTDDAGNIYDATGTLSDKDLDLGDLEYYYDDEGNLITTADYDILSKRKLRKYKTFSANREVANYFNWVGRYMDPIEPEEKEKFNLSEHGFLNYWNLLNNKIGGQTDLRPYLEMDAAVNGKRERTNRLQYLSEQLTNYLNLFEDKYDWSGSGFESAEAYKTSLRNLISLMQDGNWDSLDMIAANLAGIEGDFYNLFFTDREDPEISDELLTEELLAEESARLQAERDEQWRSYVTDLYNNYQAANYQYSENTPFTMLFTPTTITTWTDNFPHNEYYNDIAAGNIGLYLLNFFNNPFESTNSHALSYVMNNPEYHTSLSDGRYYLHWNKDNDIEQGRVLIYDPRTSHLYYDFIGNVSDLWETIRLNYSTQQEGVEQYFKTGGPINKLLNGGSTQNNDEVLIDLANANFRSLLNQELEERASQAGVDVETQKANERRIGTGFTKARTSPTQQDTEFTSVEYARIGAAAADIVSGLSAFAPGVGTVTSAVTGVGSTIANAYADFSDDGVSFGDALFNFVTNLGMDAIGLIPGGGMSGKLAKIARSIGRLLPKVALAFSLYSTASNSEEITKSLDKFINNSEDVTVADWLNLALALSTVAGASLVANTSYHRARRSNALAQKTGTNKKTVVEVTKDGQRRSMLFVGDDAVALRRARDVGGSEGKRQVNEILNRYPQTQGATVVQTSRMRPRFKGKWYNPVKWGKWKYEDTEKGAMAVYDMIVEPKGLNINNSASDAFVPTKKWWGRDLFESDISGENIINTLNTPKNTITSTNASTPTSTNALTDQQILDQLGPDLRTRRTNRIENARKWYTATLNNLKKEARNLQRKGKTLRELPESYYEFLRNHKDSNGNITWKSPDGNIQSVKESDFRQMIRKHGIRFKRGGTIEYLLSGGVTRVSYPDVEKNSSSNSISNIRNLLKISPTWLYGLPRAVYANKTNERLTDMATNAEYPMVYALPYMPKRRVVSDWDTENQGYRNAAALSSTARRLQTTDLDKYNAVLLEAATRGLDYINQAKAQSNKALQLQRELQFLENKEEAQTVNKVINANRENVFKSTANKAKYRIAGVSSNFANTDRFLQLLEYDRRTRDAENLAYADRYAEIDINNALLHNLGELAGLFGINLSPESLSIWQQVSSGEKALSTLNELELQDYYRASDIAQQLKTEMFSEYKGINRSNYSGLRLFNSNMSNLHITPIGRSISVSNSSNPIGRSISAKKGTKIKIANLKAAIKDADRFLKSLKESADRHLKMLNKLADSIYGFIEK